MKKLYFLFAVLIINGPFYLNAQWEDNFTDSNLYQNPTWYGDTSHFVVHQEKLKLNAQNAGRSFLFTQYELDEGVDIQWIFEVGVEFSPSQNNGLKYILFSSDSLYWITNGSENTLIYYLKFGEMGSMDAVELYRKDSSLADPILLCRGVDEVIASPFHRKYKVHYNAGHWEIYSSNYESPYYILEAEALDTNTQIYGAYVGLDLNYTSSNTNNFLFDDISILAFIQDTIPPFYTSTSVVDSTHVRIDFSESLDSSGLDISNYYLIEILDNPLNVEFFSIDQTSILLEFEYAFQEYIELHLELYSIQDLKGNVSEEMTLNFIYNPDYEAKLRELQFSEIMADPSPPLGLPNAEYIEIYNASDSMINLENYSLSNSGIERYFPELNLLADSFLILCKDSEKHLFSQYGMVLGIENWVSLLNTDDDLMLRNANGSLLDKVHYSNSWFNSNVKADGGWSLEKISYSNTCYGSVNWEESTASNGGTPGSQNTVVEMVIEMELYIDNIFLLDSNRVQIEIDGELDLSSLPLSMYSTSPPFEIDWGQSLISENDIKLFCTPAFKKGRNYRIQWQNLKACTGEKITTNELDFAFPEKAQKGDVVINELLFNAYTGASDFIEIVNRSNKYIDLRSWRINRMKDGVLEEDAEISNSPLIMAPNEILAFSEEADELPLLYETHSIEQLKNLYDLPNFNDDEGVVVLQNGDFEVIDRLEYDADMHFSLLEDVNGVSLERIHPDYESSALSSWVSASEKEGFASPGIENSQYWERTINALDIKIEPELFTPNNDGDRDYMFIHYNFKEGGWQAKVNIYSKDGIEVKRLVENKWISGKGIIKWDGLDNNDELLSVGIYVVYFEVFNNQGEVLIFKKPCVIGSIL